MTPDEMRDQSRVWAIMSANCASTDTVSRLCYTFLCELWKMTAEICERLEKPK